MEQIYADLIPGGKMPLLHASQYDEGREYRINLTENKQAYTLDGTELLSISVRKGDNTLFTADVGNTFGGKSYVDFVSTEQMCAVAGYNFGELTIEKNNTRIGTINFMLVCEPSPEASGLTSESEINNLNRQIDDHIDEVLPDEIAEAVPPVVEQVVGDNYYDKEQTDALLANKADSADVYNKQTVDNKLAEKANTSDVNTALATKADAAATTEALQTLTQAVNGKANASDVNTALANKVDKSTLNEFTEVLPVGKEWQEQTAESEYKDKRVFYNALYSRIACTGAQNGYGFKVYPVTAGKYRVYGHGYDLNDAGVMAVVGNADIVESGASYCTLLQIVQTGSTDYTWHEVVVDIAQNGFLYVNYYYASGKLPKVEKEIAVDQTVVITDDSLTSDYLPANSKAVGEAIKNATQKKGIIKNGTTYRHFSYSHDDKYIFRTIAPVGANGLYDYKSVAAGHFENGSAVIDTTFFTAFTDQVGPISMRIHGDTGSNFWTGGAHTKNIGGTDYPTAETQSVNVYVDGIDISNSADGIYYGDCKIITVNKLYAPATITGADLSTATLAFLETRTFILTDTLKVQVKLDFQEDIDVGLYYGMQNQDNHASKILLPTVGEELDRSTMSSGSISNEKEWRIMLTDSNQWHFDMILSASGLGDWGKNDGTSAYGRLSHYLTTKIYFVLCSGGTFSRGSIFFWEGEYRTYKY